MLGLGECEKGMRKYEKERERVREKEDIFSFLLFCQLDLSLQASFVGVFCLSRTSNETDKQ